MRRPMSWSARLGLAAVFVTSVAGALFATVEWALNVLVGVVVLGGGGAVLAWLGLRALWQNLLIEYEIRRPIHPDEIRWTPPPRAEPTDDTGPIPTKDGAS